MATTTTQELRPGARYRIQSIERAVSILNAFSAETPELGVTELAERLALHKSTVHRFLVNLEAGGWSSATRARSATASGFASSSWAGWCCSR